MKPQNQTIRSSGMREIKFRAWTKDWGVNSRMLYSDELELIYNKDGLQPINDIGTELIFMQFTGLKDSKGVEIYEGDIVECGKQFETPEKHIISIKEGVACINDTCMCPLYPMVNRCVLGNIYENPELLRDKK